MRTGSRFCVCVCVCIHTTHGRAQKHTYTHTHTHTHMLDFDPVVPLRTVRETTNIHTYAVNVCNVTHIGTAYELDRKVWKGLDTVLRQEKRRIKDKL